MLASYIFMFDRNVDVERFEASLFQAALYA